MVLDQQVSDAKNLLTGIVVNKFSWDDFGFKDINKSRNKIKTTKYNSENFINWVLNTLKLYNNKERPNSTAIYMNCKNNEYLRKNIDGFIWLSHSPKDDDSLEDDEYKVNIDEI